LPTDGGPGLREHGAAVDMTLPANARPGQRPLSAKTDGGGSGCTTL